MFKRINACVFLVAVCAWAVSASADVVIETVTVGNPGNEGELSGIGAGGGGPDRICGAVDYVYDIGRFEITTGQYCEFLNAVAATDTYELYDTCMYSNRGCYIRRWGSSGSYTYSVEEDRANRPVNYVSWGDSARFCNWLHNGQPTGPQGLSTTEDGSYFLDGAMYGMELVVVDREPDATWSIPTEDEWYKAAYHKNDGATGNYFDFPTSSNTWPGCINDAGFFSRPGDGYFMEGGTDPGNYATYNPDGGLDGIGGPYYRTEVGEHENSGSPYGTFDQGGNVREWNEAILYGNRRGIRGCGYRSAGSDMRAVSRSGNYPWGDSDFAGFRISLVPEPATIVMLEHSLFLCSEPRALARADAPVPSPAQQVENRYTKTESAVALSCAVILGSRKR